jgi:hypothetical protein
MILIIIELVGVCEFAGRLTHPLRVERKTRWCSVLRVSVYLRRDVAGLDAGARRRCCSCVEYVDMSMT